MNKKINILGMKINITNMENVIQCVNSIITSKNKSGYMCVANVHTVITGRKNKDFMMVNNKAKLSIPDGTPLVWFSKIKGHKSVNRTAGPDLMTEIFKRSNICNGTQIKHYFYGSTNENLKMLKSELIKKYPDLHIVGMYSPPFRNLSEEEQQEIIDKINRLAPDIVWVGLGAPKQEIWMSDVHNKLSNSLLIGVGAAFNFHSGLVKRAPLFMQQCGLEWLYRLLQEPKRLFKRYLTTNILFFYFLIKDELLMRKKY
jgi:N-acetylglucosaminyldiphosphoundecaprenol N-acetyl-beta-D-mannosaminyltransferase